MGEHEKQGKGRRPESDGLSKPIPPGNPRADQADAPEKQQDVHGEPEAPVWLLQW
jgi:hypothetical protein